ncbi:hypothetical protein NBRC116492_05330 [Aurantivibrio infirmus]
MLLKISVTLLEHAGRESMDKLGCSRTCPFTGIKHGADAAIAKRQFLEVPISVFDWAVVVARDSLGYQQWPETIRLRCS